MAWQGWQRRPDTVSAEQRIREVLLRLPDPKRPPRLKPVHHGRKCKECRHWPACAPVVGLLYEDSDYCHQPNVGPTFEAQP